MTAADGESNYIGFRPVTVNNTGGKQHPADHRRNLHRQQALRPGSSRGTEFTDVTWLDRGIFTFRSDASALNGFRLVGFSSGTDLNMEEAFMEYNADTVVEYVNSKLGFTLSYPAVFDDELLKEDETGVSAELPDKSASPLRPPHPEHGSERPAELCERHRQRSERREGHRERHEQLRHRSLHHR